jgi:hypothetical protein
VSRPTTTSVVKRGLSAGEAELGGGGSGINRIGSNSPAKIGSASYLSGGGSISGGGGKAP